MRYFIAIDLPSKIIDELVRVQKELARTNSFDGKFVEPENLHLTMRFLGELNFEKLNSIKQALKAICFESFEMSLGQLGIFVPEMPRVLWVDLLGKDVYLLQGQIDQAIKSFVEPEPKPFVSHVTLARIKFVHQLRMFLKEIENARVEPLIFSVDKFILKQSELTPDGPIYHDVEVYSAFDVK